MQTKLVHAEIGVGAVGQPDRARGAGDFLHDDAVLKIAEPKPTERLRHRDAMHAELAELRPQIARKGIAAIDLGGARSYPRGREAAHALAQHVRRFPEPEIEPPETACQHRISLLRIRFPGMWDDTRPVATGAITVGRRQAKREG